jgi:hypothetical protein
MIEARRFDRFLISIDKCAGVLHSEDGQSAVGYFNDVSAEGCQFVIPAEQVALRMRQIITIKADGYELHGRVMRSSIYGGTISLGLEVIDMPPVFLERVARFGGALRLGYQTVMVINNFSVPVAFQAAKLIERPDISVVDLQYCTGMEAAGAGFLVKAVALGKKIKNVNPGIAQLVELAGVKAMD